MMNPEKPALRKSEDSPDLKVAADQTRESSADLHDEIETGDVTQDRTLLNETAIASGSPDLAPGSTFAGKYRIEAHLGSGGMSVVYKAKDLVLNRLVAIKVLNRSHAPDERSMLRFAQEAKAAGALSHPGIIAVHEFAVSDDGQTFMVMDFVNGEPLASAISRSGCLPLSRCIDVAMQAADALAHAHKAGVIHRDLKPGNIMLVTDDSGREQVRIVDFGIAKITAPESGHSLTQTGEVFGSPLYMSPEQCEGTRVDQRSDIYSLGCVLYETLVGKPPHRGDSPLSTALKHINDEPDTLNEARPDISFSADLENIVSRMLEKDFTMRYASMSELQADLKTLAAGLPVKGQTRVAARKHRVNLLLYWAGIFFLAIAAMVALVPIFLGMKISQAPLAVLFVIGFDLFIASVLLHHETSIRKKPATLTEFAQIEFEAIQPAFSNITPSLRGILAWLVIGQLFLLGLYSVWSMHPDRSLLDPIPREEIHR